MVTVYVLRGAGGRRYVGMTGDLSVRLREHRARRRKGGQAIGPFEVVVTEAYSTYDEARQRERFLKSGQGRQWLDEMLPRPRPAAGG